MSEMVEKWKVDVECEERLSLAKYLALDKLRTTKHYTIGKRNRVEMVKLEDVERIIEEMR